MTEEKNENLPAVKASIPIVNGVLVPSDFDGLWRLCSVICKTDIAGPYKNKPEDGFVACQLGMSVGLSYMQSLQSVAVIKGKPSLYGNATTAVIQASNLLEDHREYWELDGENMENYDGPEDLGAWPDTLKAVVVMKRNGMSPFTGYFSVADAKRMGKWDVFTDQGNKSVWQKHPKDMLMWKARHKAQTAGFSDILRGMLPAAIARDYEATDLEKTSSGSYEAKVSTSGETNTSGEKSLHDEPVVNAKVEAHPNPVDLPKEKAPIDEKRAITEDMKFIIAFAQENDLSVAALEEFIQIIANENDTTLDGLKPDIIARKDEFIGMFNSWSGGIAQDDGEQETSAPEATTPEVVAPEVVAPEVVAPEVVEEDTETEYRNKCQDLRKDLYAFFDGYVPDGGDDIKGRLDMNEMMKLTKLNKYVSYCVEMTKRSELDILTKANENPSSFLDYFYGWIKLKDIDLSDSQSEPEAPPEVENQTGNVEAVAPETKEPKPEGKSMSEFVRKFKNMPAPKFIAFVRDNKESFEGCSSEDFKEAVRKWETMRAQGKIGDNWPYPQEQKNIDFNNGKTGMLNARQRIANLKLAHPGQVEDARKKLGFAMTVGEEACVQWEQKAHELIEKKAKHDRRKSR